MSHVEHQLLTVPGHLSSFPFFFTFLGGVCVVHGVKVHVFTFLVPCCDVRYDFPHKTMFVPSCFVV